METIMTRTSIRRFTNEKVSKEDIEKMLRAAMAAPSASNKQPWEFIVVQNEEKIQLMSELTPFAKPLKTAP